MPPLGGARRGGRPGHRAARRRAGPPAHPRRLRRRGAGRRAGRRPQRRRPALPPAAGPTRRPRGPGRRRPRCASPPPADCGEDVLALLSDPSWVYRQYDHQLFLNTVDGPGGDAAVLRLAAPGLPPSDNGLALTTDSNPTWCSIDPRAGTAATVAESALNVACAGARPWPWSTASTSAIPSIPRSCGSCRRPSTA